MTLTLFSDYSLRVLMFAALHPDRPVSVDQMAEAYGLSRHHVAKVVNFLTQKGHLHSRRGRGGGVTLGHPADQIGIGEVLRSTEGHTPLIECFNAETNTCPLIHACVLQGALGKAWNAFFEVLDGYTLADLVRNRKALMQRLSLPA